VHIGDLVDGETLRRRVLALLAAEKVVRERRGKTYDLRPLIRDLGVLDTEDGPRLTTRLSQLPGETGRPDELLLALELDPLDVRVHRSSIMLEEDIDPEG
jgi:hypothetical protein